MDSGRSAAWRRRRASDAVQVALATAHSGKTIKLCDALLPALRSLLLNLLGLVQMGEWVLHRYLAGKDGETGSLPVLLQPLLL
eukprot:4327058-Pyramimonas_sp.AAC.1